VLRFAPAAAAQASKVGAHREAALLYEKALRVPAAMPLRERAKLLEGRAAECFLTVEFEAAADAMRGALDATPSSATSSARATHCDGSRTLSGRREGSPKRSRSRCGPPRSLSCSPPRGRWWLPTAR
jgi:hypothetical protein